MARQLTLEQCYKIAAWQDVFRSWLQFSKSLRSFLAVTLLRRSPDLMPWDVLLWGFIKSKVYAIKRRDLSQLEERIRTACGEVGEEMLQKVGEACV